MRILLFGCGMLAMLAVEVVVLCVVVACAPETAEEYGVRHRQEKAERCPP